MVWRVLYRPEALKELRKLDRAIAHRIVRFVDERLVKGEDPRVLGQALRGSEQGRYWKYRIGDYRVIAEIRDLEVLILIVRMGNRKDVYR
ncbi:MAG: type II toxin-antitoxin system RelE/ParE family toxin [Betaproteobacteria bacterium]|nr:type II toxin-antitoxin system RelE/ParE family toxin [Betaproteobacteria bacterium]